MRKEKIPEVETMVEAPQECRKDLGRAEMSGLGHEGACG